ncbi:MAG: TIGR02646 family protein [Burkholderiaceae bacterium]|nr:TIGR02646 family protein [Burkholderiaceae bacterium]
MRSITKRGEPQALTAWKREMQVVPQNLQYGNLPSDVKDEVKRALLQEQGWLCAYTLRRLRDGASCHIEHVMPQGLAPDLDLDYSNLAACFPPDGGDVSHGYGAPVKAGQAVRLNIDFVSPHGPACEVRFQFDTKGSVQGAQGDLAAQRTVDLLKLDDRSLGELRRSAIEAHGLGLVRRTNRVARKLKSAAEARRFAAEVLMTDHGGRLEPFCVALAQVALAYAEKEEARSQRLR